MSKSRSKATGGKGAKRPAPGRPPARNVSSATGEEAHLPWGRRNYILLAIGAVMLVLGFLLLSIGDTTAAPILLVIGYLGLIPWGIVASRNKASGGEKGANSDLTP